MTNQEAIHIIENVNANNNCINCFYKYDVTCEDCRVNTALEKAIEALKNQKVGYWEENAPEWQNIDPPYICSECGNFHLRKTNYCDQCGAKIIEQHKSEDNNETD